DPSQFLPRSLAARSALRLHNRLMSRGRYPRLDCGCFVASSPLRLSPHGSASCSCDLHSPLGVLDSLRIKAFNRSRRLPAPLALSPDCLLLPVTVSISSVRNGSSFLACYDSAG